MIICFFAHKVTLLDCDNNQSYLCVVVLWYLYILCVVVLWYLCLLCVVVLWYLCLLSV